MVESGRCAGWYAGDGFSHGRLSPTAPCYPLRPPGPLNPSTFNSDTIQPYLTVDVLPTPPQAGGSSAPPCGCCLVAGYQEAEDPQDCTEAMQQVAPGAGLSGKAST
jgi:hypothetical protein